jgi:hypothetical protein
LIIADTIALLIQIRNWMGFKRVGGLPGSGDRTNKLADGVVRQAQDRGADFSPPNGFLFFNRAEWKDCFAVKLIKNLRQAGVDCGEATDEPFVAGEMFKARAGIGEVTISQQKKQYRQ